MLSTNIRAALDDRDTIVPGFKTAIMESRHIENWERMAHTLEAENKRWSITAHVLGAVSVGLCLALLWCATHLAPAEACKPLPPSEMTGDPAVMPLDPTTIRAAREAPVWL